MVRLCLAALQSFTEMNEDQMREIIQPGARLSPQRVRNGKPWTFKFVLLYFTDHIYLFIYLFVKSTDMRKVLLPPPRWYRVVRVGVAGDVMTSGPNLPLRGPGGGGGGESVNVTAGSEGGGRVCRRIE